MGMTLKELLTKGEGTLSAQEAKALAAQCRMDVDTLYTLLEERGIKVLEEENEPSLDVDSIIAEVENAENNNDDMGLADENEEDAEENPADLKAAMDELLDDPVKNYLKQIGQIPLLSAEQEVELSRRIHAGAEAAHILQADRQKYGAPEYIKKNSARFSFEEDENSRSYTEDLDEPLDFLIAANGRSIPSKIFVIMPGASVTETGAPVPVTGSPGFRPVVSS